VGIGTAIAIYVWKRESAIALAAMFAMTLNFVMAALAGVLVPLGLKKIRVDPALAAAAFVTGITDTLGFLFFLGIAALLI
jgi:magnesium transporter